MPIKAENRSYDRNQENTSKRIQSSRRHVMPTRQITSTGERTTEQPKEMRRRDRRNVQFVELLCHSDYGRAVARAGFDVDDCDEAPT